MRKLLAGTMAVALMPFVAQAATADELAAQAQALLQQVQALQAQLSAQGSASVVTSTNGTVINPTTGAALPVAGSAGVNSSACPNIGRALKLGSSGDDVARLQQFLAREATIYPEAMVTGYYGSLTQAAVQRWQVKYNIVSSGTPATTGYGVVGPRTAAAIALLCSTGVGQGAGDNVGGFLQITPTSGAAPLRVAIIATVNTTHSCAGATYDVYFGDSQIPASIQVPQNSCGEMQQAFNHVYASGGAYTITLRSGVHQTTAIVSVSGSSGSSGSGSTGGGALSVTAGTNGNPFNVTAQFDLQFSCARYDLDWGDGTSHALQAEGSCASGAVSANANHVYQSGGTYTITLRRGASLQTTDTAAVVIVN